MGRKFFTIIELLVVMAIISIIASILLPALTQARAMAKSSSCLNNKRQIAQAGMAYLEDYNGYYPLACDPLNMEIPNWSDNYNAYMGGKGKRDEVIIRKPKVWGCPALAKWDTLSTAGYANHGRIILNITYLETANPKFGSYVKNSRVTNVSTQPLTMECVQKQYFVNLTYWYFTNLVPYNESLEFRHNQGMTMSFCDGHAAIIKERNSKYLNNWYNGELPPAGDYYWSPP